MDKQYTNEELINIIKDIMLSGYTYMSMLASQIREIESESADEDIVDRYNSLLNKLIIINEILHFGHNISLKLFTVESHPFIEECIRQREISLERAKKMDLDDSKT